MYKGDIKKSFCFERTINLKIGIGRRYLKSQDIRSINATLRPIFFFYKIDEEDTTMKKWSIKEICDQIDRFIAGEIKDIDNRSICFDLNNSFKKKIGEHDLALFCDCLVKIAKTKNRKIRKTEQCFWNYVRFLPLDLEMQTDNDKNDEDEWEELLSNTPYADKKKRKFSKLLGLAEEILELKEDRGRASEIRRAASLELISEIMEYYFIPTALPLFWKSLKSEKKGEQYAALEGFSNYYAYTEDDIDSELIEILDGILSETDDRSIASTCLQIQINAGIMDQGSALWQLDEWKADDESDNCGE